MQKNITTEFVCLHGTTNNRCSICQPSLSYGTSTGNIGEIIEAARPRLLRLARLNGIGPDGAEDVVQETCLEAWRHLETLREPERFSAWLDGICRNICKRHIRASPLTCLMSLMANCMVMLLRLSSCINCPCSMV